MSPQLALLLVAATVCASAHGQNGEDVINSDRPGLADGSEVVGKGRVQLETGVQRETRKAGDSPERKTFLPTLLRWGFAESWEARLESDVHAWMREPEGERTQAYAPLSFGFKHHLLAAGDRWPSLGAIVRVSPPSGTGTLRSSGTTGDVRIAADWALTSQWSFNPNAGLALDRDDEGRSFTAALLAATLSYRPYPSLELFIDSGLRRPEARGGGSAIVYDAGVAYLVTRDVQVDASMGIRGRGETPPRGFLAVGVSVRF